MLPAVMSKVKSAFGPWSASRARTRVTKLETGAFSLRVMFIGRLRSTGSLSLMSSTRMPTRIYREEKQCRHVAPISIPPILFMPRPGQEVRFPTQPMKIWWRKAPVTMGRKRREGE